MSRVLCVVLRRRLPPVEEAAAFLSLVQWILRDES